MMRVAFDFPEMTEQGPFDERLVKIASEVVAIEADTTFDVIVREQGLDSTARVRATFSGHLDGRVVVRCWSCSPATCATDLQRLLRAAFILSHAPDLVVTSDDRLTEGFEQLFQADKRSKLPRVFLVEDIAEPSIPHRDAVADVAKELWTKRIASSIEAVRSPLRSPTLRSGSETMERATLAFVVAGSGNPGSAKLLREICDSYDVVVFSERPPEGDAFPRSTRWKHLDQFEDDAGFDRLVYSLADDAISLPILHHFERQPGLLHISQLDLPELLRARDAAARSPNATIDRLFHSHGHQIDTALAGGEGLDSVARRFPGNREILEQALGILAPYDTAARARDIFGASAALIWVYVDRAPHRIASAIEDAYGTSRTALPRLIEQIRRSSASGGHAAQLPIIAQSIAETFPGLARKRHLYVDVSSISRHDVRTGIQRVVRAIVARWLTDAPGDLSVAPVYLSRESGRWTYYHARRWSAHLMGMPLEAVDQIEDPVAEPAAGDILTILDFTGSILYAAEERDHVLTSLRNRGLHVCSVVYDLLPLRWPQFFPTIATEHGRWIETVAAVSDQIVCISRAVADDVRLWFEENDIAWSGRIDDMHLGSNIESSHPTTGIPPALEAAMGALGAGPTFLTVGTVEPRKGQAQILDAFDRLGETGTAVNLVIVGKLGWMSEELKDRIEDHPLRGQSLFWFPDVSDEALLALYRISDCLIAASHGEGFGLPLVEAAKHDLPILARDISVFREVAGDHAAYFTGSLSSDLATAIEEWLRLQASDAHPRSGGMRWLTWEESARQLLGLVREGAGASSPAPHGVDDSIADASSSIMDGHPRSPGDPGKARP